MSTGQNYEVIDAGEGGQIKAWIRGVPVDEGALEQLRNAARLPIVHRYRAER